MSKLIKKTQERDYNLDVLKAIAIFLVLIWHLQPIRMGADGNETVLIIRRLIDLIYSKSLVAVPIFYFVSLLIFFRKKQFANKYIRKRIIRLLNIFVFWFVVQLVCYFCVKVLSIYLDLPIHLSPQNSNLLWVIFMGGPSLPSVGDSVFYFISNLILLVSLSAYYSKMASKGTDITIFIILSLYIILHQYIYAIPYWRIDNFLIYIPLSHFIARANRQILVSKKYLCLSLFIYLLFSIYEIFLRKTFHITLNAYEINSLHWGVISIFLFVNIYSFPENKLVIWLSKYSLGIFALHKYWLLVSTFIIMQLAQKNILNIDDGFIQYSHIIIAILTLCFTWGTVKLVGRMDVLRNYVR